MNAALAVRLRRAGLLSGRMIVALLSVAMLSGVGFGWATLDRVSSTLRTVDVLSPPPPPGQPGDGATDILLVGSDSRTDAQGNPLPPFVLQLLRTGPTAGLNTDTIILVRVPDDGGAAHAVSIPRDSYVDIPGYGKDKINAAFRLAKTDVERELADEGVRNPAQLAQVSDEAGQRSLVATVERFTGVRVDRYAEISLYGFYLLTEAIGGVDVCLSSATSDPNSGAMFRAGPQRISGSDALAFVRQRVNLPRGDLDRVVRQQVFLAAATDKLLSSGTLSDPDRLAALVKAVERSVVLDSGWDVIGFAQQIQGIAAGAVDFSTIPVTSIYGMDDRGQSIVTVDREEVRAFVRGLLDIAAPTPPLRPLAAPPPQAGSAAASGTTVDVLNGTASAGLGDRVSRQLRAAGFRIGDVGRTPVQGITFVLASPSAMSDAQRVATELGGLLVEQDSSLNPGEVLVLLGSDYAGPGINQLRGAGLVGLDGSGSPRPAQSTEPSPEPEDLISADTIPCVN